MPAMKKTIISLTALAMLVSAATHAEADTSKKTDFLLIGGGIMSASLGTAAGAAAGLGSDHGGETRRRGAGVFQRLE